MFNKIVIVIWCLCFFLFYSFAQDTIPNPGFENWHSSGTSGEDPDYWSSTNMLTVMGYPVAIYKSTDKHSGTYALKVVSRRDYIPSPFGPNDTAVVNGILKNNDDILKDYGSPFTGRPDSMRVYIKGTVANPGSDACRVSFDLTRYDAIGGSTETVGDADYYMLSTLASYTEIFIPITYYSANTPDTLVMSIAASFTGKADNELFVDDMSFIYGEVPVVLSSFYGEAIGNGVILYWSTATEQDNLGFNILRSGSKQGDFTRVNDALIPGAGTTSQPQEYSYLDAQVGTGTFYYKIESIDINGAKNLSPVISVDTTPLAIKPAKKQYTIGNTVNVSAFGLNEISVFSKIHTKAVITLTAMDGRIIQKAKGQILVPGKNAISFIWSFASGVYLLKLKTGSLEMQSRILIVY